MPLLATLLHRRPEREAEAAPTTPRPVPHRGALPGSLVVVSLLLAVATFALIWMAPPSTRSRDRSGFARATEGAFLFEDRDQILRAIHEAAAGRDRGVAFLAARVLRNEAVHLEPGIPLSVTQADDSVAMVRVDGGVHDGRIGFVVVTAITP